MQIHRVSDAFRTHFDYYQYALPGLPLKKVGILHSIGGVGKSYWAMQACFQAAAAGSCDFQFKAIADHPALAGGKVIYISFEDEWSDFGRRAKAFYESFKEDKEKRAWIEDIGDLFDFIFIDSPIIASTSGGGDISFTKAFEPLDAYLKYLKEENIPINLIVFDTLARMHALDENDNKDMSLLVSWLERLARSLGCAVLVLHHDNKISMTSLREDQNGATAAIRGASALSSNVRWHASLRAMSKSDAATLGVSNEKRKQYLRIELDKTSYSPPIDGAWLKRIDGGVLRVADFEKGDDRGY